MIGLQLKEVYLVTYCRITAQDNTSTATVSWMVVGERKDQGMIDSPAITDDNGRLITEARQEFINTNKK